MAVTPAHERPDAGVKGTIKTAFHVVVLSVVTLTVIIVCLMFFTTVERRLFDGLAWASSSFFGKERVLGDYFWHRRLLDGLANGMTIAGMLALSSPGVIFYLKKKIAAMYGYFLFLLLLAGMGALYAFWLMLGALPNG